MVIIFIALTTEQVSGDFRELSKFLSGLSCERIAFGYEDCEKILVVKIFMIFMGFPEENYQLRP